MEQGSNTGSYKLISLISDKKKKKSEIFSIKLQRAESERKRQE